MDAVASAAIIFVVVTCGAAGFQLALALGAPWGSCALGGRFPGRFPGRMRVAAVAQAGILGLLAGVVLARAGLALGSWAQAATWLAWVVVAFSGVSLLLNSLTPSPRERRLWLPVTVVMPGSSQLMALAG